MEADEKFRWFDDCVSLREGSDEMGRGSHTKWSGNDRDTGEDGDGTWAGDEEKCAHMRGVVKRTLSLSGRLLWLKRAYRVDSL